MLQLLIITLMFFTFGCEGNRLASMNKTWQSKSMPDRSKIDIRPTLKVGQDTNSKLVTQNNKTPTYPSQKNFTKDKQLPTNLMPSIPSTPTIKISEPRNYGIYTFTLIGGTLLITSRKRAGDSQSDNYD